MRYQATVPPEEISSQLMPIVEELGLVENCRQLASEGYTIIENVADPQFITRLRNTILETVPTNDAGSGSKLVVLGTDPVYAEALLNPKVMAMAEFSVGRGNLIGSLIPTIRAKGDPALDLHADQVMFPEPLPVHNMMFTACWVTDEFTMAGGATRVVPGTNRHLRHPTEQEEQDSAAAIATECPAGSVVVWDGRVWHGNYARNIDGQRVVLHATYYRLLMRPANDYSDVADELIATYGKPMSTLLGREDYMYKKGTEYMNDPEIFTSTMNNARS
jgi:hypothetical protein